MLLTENWYVTLSNTEKPKAEGKHEKILNVNIFFWFCRFISLNDFLVNNNQTKVEKNIFAAATKKMVKKSP